MSKLFDQKVSVPRCCLALPVKEKCRPCLECVRAWYVWHDHCQRWEYPADVTPAKDEEWNRLLDEAIVADALANLPPLSASLGY